MRPMYSPQVAAEPIHTLFAPADAAPAPWPTVPPRYLQFGSADLVGLPPDLLFGTAGPESATSALRAAHTAGTAERRAGRAARPAQQLARATKNTSPSTASLRSTSLCVSESTSPSTSRDSPLSERSPASSPPVAEPMVSLEPPPLRSYPAVALISEFEEAEVACTTSAESELAEARRLLLMERQRLQQTHRVLTETLSGSPDRRFSPGRADTERRSSTVDESVSTDGTASVDKGLEARLGLEDEQTQTDPPPVPAPDAPYIVVSPSSADGLPRELEQELLALRARVQHSEALLQQYLSTSSASSGSADPGHLSADLTDSRVSDIPREWGPRTQAAPTGRRPPSWAERPAERPAQRPAHRQETNSYARRHGAEYLPVGPKPFYRTAAHRKVDEELRQQQCQDKQRRQRSNELNNRFRLLLQGTQ